MRALFSLSALLLPTVASLAEVSQDCRAPDPAKAIGGCTIFLQNTSTNRGDQSYAYTLRADAFISLRQYDAAAKDLEKAFQLIPNNVLALATRGRLHYMRSDFKRAIADADAALRLVPNFSPARRLRGAVQMELSNYVEARKDLDWVIANSPTDAVALANRGKLHRLQNNNEMALADLDRAVALAPRSWTWPLLQRADTYQITGDYRRAIADYDQVLAVTPNDVEVQRRRAAALALLNRRGPMPTSPPAPSPGNATGPSGPAGPPAANATANVEQMLQQARLMLDRRDAMGAHRIASDLLKANPGLAEAYQVRGRAFYQESMYPEALDDLNKYVGLKPSDATGHYLRGLAHANLGHSNEALADADQLQRLAATDTRGHFLRGFTHLLAARYQQADDEYSAGIKMRANDSLYVNRALARMELGRYGDAEADLQQAYAINARNAAIAAIRGQLQVRTARIEQAEASFRDALAIDPSNVAARIGQQALFTVRAMKQLPSFSAQPK
jgi:tetratricopeptide (TPR) repeat protein